MKSRRIIGSLIATALAAASLSVVTIAAPANAVETVPTRIVAGDSRGILSAYSKPLRYGDDIRLSVEVEAFVAGAWKQIYNGPLSVTQQVAGSKNVHVVTEVTSAYAYKSFPARGRATYMVYYGGGTGEYPAVNYAPASLQLQVKNVQRGIKITPKSGSKKKLGLAGKISPKGKYRVIVLKKVGKKWKKYKGLRTTSRGTFFARLPAPSKRGKKVFWKIAIPGSGAFSQTNSGVYYTTKY